MDRTLILDANILIRAMLGQKVLPLLQQYQDVVHYWTPDIAFSDCERHVRQYFLGKGIRPETVDAIMEEITPRLLVLVSTAPETAYAAYEAEARRRLRRRDESDWPYVALAMKLQCPIWTEDQDFFGTGIPIWTSDRVEIFLAGGA